MKQTYIYIIRHGETVWNKKKRFQGQKDIPLSDKGQKQALDVGTSMKHIPLSAIYSSPLLRANQTASAIHTHHATIPLAVDNSLMERSFGILEGKLYSEAVTAFPWMLERRAQETPSMKMPEGESLLDVKNRTEIFLKNILQHHIGDHIALVSHGVTIRVMIHVLTNIPLEETKTYSFSNTSITVITYHEKEGGMIHLLNHADHLEV